MRLLLAVLVLLCSVIARAEECGDPAAMQLDAYRGRLTDADRACLDEAIAGTDPAARSAASFTEIVDAYVAGDQTRYGALMRRHLSEIHTTDAEVAYLYATWLWRQGQATDETLKWTRVAMDGRRRWLSNRANYDRMVKSLYDMLVQVSMERAIAISKEYQATPTPELAQRLNDARKQARYYMIVAAPCLYQGDCGPYFEVEVEGFAPCDDLVAMQTMATRGTLTADHMACLRSKYRKPASPKERILEILAAQANTDTSGATWEALLAWHWNLIEDDDPTLAAGYAEFLVAHRDSSDEDALHWAEVALSHEDGLEGRSGKQVVARLHQLRVDTARHLLDTVQARFDADPNPYHTKSLEDAKATLGRVTAEREAYCANNPCP